MGVLRDGGQGREGPHLAKCASSLQRLEATAKRGRCGAPDWVALREGAGALLGIVASKPAAKMAATMTTTDTLAFRLLAMVRRAAKGTCCTAARSFESMLCWLVRLCFTA